MGGSELLFYGGMFLMALALALGLLSLIVLKIQAGRLRKVLDQEYGPAVKRDAPAGPQKGS